MARVSFTPRVEADLYGIWSSIAADNVAAADGPYRRILNKVELAADLPGLGAARPELSPTARILVEGRYIVIYEPQPDGVLVVAIVHGMRDVENWLS
ncbi:type II toxin-antitoxin system RelE/ParE family toxin [Blastochloris sulfoviridis]|uniref:Type II toxin-antitoxin system RelE/ParE family toxin n=1 Tax=Blastochloris sulfoviridis TaxID=50712 RepID=A0A5M6HWY7_9HYPH|nr:type II toxin-antitoxin system RelE/ParE family toxin [Blastochloris sulfoviridis]KAA5600386.1 type II toxin-antitoxin system RelE/ParE family toxin [Blastochloris sulfoviridis]